VSAGIAGGALVSFMSGRRHWASHTVGYIRLLRRLQFCAMPAGCPCGVDVLLGMLLGGKISHSAVQRHAVSMLAQQMRASSSCHHNQHMVLTQQISDPLVTEQTWSVILGCRCLVLVTTYSA
jgi:hypothetical protein